MVAIKTVMTPQEFAAAECIQLDVFCREQGIPEPLCKDGNVNAHHILAMDGDRPVATARLTVGGNGVAELARIAVLPSHRSCGLGRALVRKLEEAAVQREVTELVLHPHLHLESFYASLGYSTSGASVDVVGGHDLITMRKTIRH